MNIESTVEEISEPKPIDMASRALLAPAGARTLPAVADMVFNNLFAWQDYFDYRFVRCGDFLIVYYVEGSVMNALPPFGASLGVREPGWGDAFAGCARALQGFAAGRGMSLAFQAFPGAWLPFLPAGVFTAAADRDSADYVYRREVLCELPGQKLSPKRNLISQFTRQNRWHYEPLCPGNLALARDFVKNWQFAKRPAHRILGLGAHCMACRLVDYFGVLDNLCGGILLVDGRVVAATMATIVDEFEYAQGIFPTAIVHHENALVEYKGAYQMINREFCASLPERVRYVNREEDMGLPGLRKAKLSYDPEILLEKSRLELR